MYVLCIISEKRITEKLNSDEEHGNTNWKLIEIFRMGESKLHRKKIHRYLYITT